MSNYTLYGAEFSLYSGKARAYLNYKNIPFNEELSTLKVYKNIIIPKTGVKFIPVVKTPNNEYLQDTTNIIDQLEKQHPEKSVYPNTPRQKLVSLLLELYGDEWLLIPAMHYRWNFNNFPFIYQEFGRVISPKLPAFIRGFIGKKIGSRFKNIVPMLGITEKTIPEIERWYEQEFLVDFNTHLSQHDFLLGDAPCIGDFGFYGPLYAHLYRDPQSGELMKSLAPNVVKWVERMKDASEVKGDFLENDEIPETLFPILKHLFKCQWPVLKDTSERLTKWFKENGDSAVMTDVPRRLGMHLFKVGNVEEERLVLPYSLWMMQRPLNYYQSLSTEEQKTLEPLLQQVDGVCEMQFSHETNISRVNNQFVIKAV
jgi:glutathione S-transferase